MDGNVYFTDGPCVFRFPDGALGMTWSSWSERGYAVGLAVSPTGSVLGPWQQSPVPVYPQDGGHGMLFHDRDGRPFFTLHYPNTRFQEHPVFLPAELSGRELRLLPT